MASHYSHNDDIILLIEDAVYCANPQHKYFKLLKSHSVYCLSEDIEARGLALFTGDNIQMVNYREFVKLTAQHPPSITWS
ncbi:sulfurtransferase complex subunit TusB [Vibrio salinus]|uniref:sulfurtransferase complex subunit TusB n=1 Tax=Vibrio salinus TaxID=2899784 RepID=UPI001E2E4A77|nr:sulfurtransferase complex subunit TusB [Vibrio salinus]MCE0493477.1 sulfurtransferase complex subunit TusB [Vibrio salinus]